MIRMFWTTMMNSTANLHFLRKILVLVRMVPIILILLLNLFVQEYVLVLIDFVRPISRYLQCLTNLICMRLVMILLGLFRFGCENFQFFSRKSTKFTMKSGWVGIAIHRNIIDFIYYNYLLSPLWVRLLIYHHNGTRKLYYCPLKFSQALYSACTLRGFQPIIIHNELDFKRIPYRKMNLRNLIVECFEEIRGSILIYIPSVIQDQYIPIDRQIAQGCYKNQRTFLRSGVGFKMQFPNQQPFKFIYQNQIELLMKITSSLNINNLNITALTFRNHHNRYNNVQAYMKFINQFYCKDDKNKLNQTYEEYVHLMEEKYQNKFIQK